MEKIRFFLITVCLVASSCTKEKTDYEATIDKTVPEYAAFEEVANIQSEGYDIRVDALNGTFYKGYNALRVHITDSRTNEPTAVSDVTLLPVATDADGERSSCPHRSELVYQSDSSYFSGYLVFTSESNEAAAWELHIGFTVANEAYSVQQAVAVQEQPNKNLNMTAFTGKDGQQYLIALVSPQRPNVAENKLVAGIYRLDNDAAQPMYTEASGYTLLLDPRMPEPSMGNHSSPNNVDLTQQSDGLYHGVVNYTMTGNWTLNFILLNADGRIVKGTEVPTDFTPGVEGVKSELHIDVLF